MLSIIIPLPITTPYYYYLKFITVMRIIIIKRKAEHINKNTTIFSKAVPWLYSLICILKRKLLSIYIYTYFVVFKVLEYIQFIICTMYISVLFLLVIIEIGYNYYNTTSFNMLMTA